LNKCAMPGSIRLSHELRIANTAERKSCIRGMNSHRHSAMNVLKKEKRNVEEIKTTKTHLLLLP